MIYNNLDYTMTGSRIDENKLKTDLLPKYKTEHIFRHRMLRGVNEMREAMGHDDVDENGSSRDVNLLLDNLFTTKFTTVFFADIDREEKDKLSMIRR